MSVASDVLFMKPRHAAAVAALLGLFVPLTLEGAFWLFHLGPDWSGLLFLLWPSSIQLMVLSRPNDPWTLVLVMSIGINMILYAAIGWVIGLLYRQVHGRSKDTLP